MVQLLWWSPSSTFTLHFNFITYLFEVRAHTFLKSYSVSMVWMAVQLKFHKYFLAVYRAFFRMILRWACHSTVNRCLIACNFWRATTKESNTSFSAKEVLGWQDEGEGFKFERRWAQIELSNKTSSAPKTIEECVSIVVPPPEEMEEKGSKSWRFSVKESNMTFSAPKTIGVGVSIVGSSSTRGGSKGFKIKRQSPLLI